MSGHDLLLSRIWGHGKSHFRVRCFGILLWSGSSRVLKSWTTTGHEPTQFQTQWALCGGFGHFCSVYMSELSFPEYEHFLLYSTPLSGWLTHVSFLPTVALDHNAEMIVMGARGLGKLKRALLGSVSDYVLRKANIPVLVCKWDKWRYSQQVVHISQPVRDLKTV